MQKAVSVRSSNKRCTHDESESRESDFFFLFEFVLTLLLLVEQIFQTGGRKQNILMPSSGQKTLFEVQDVI